jgi:hypothetical protein
VAQGAALPFKQSDYNGATGNCKRSEGEGAVPLSAGVLVELKRKWAFPRASENEGFEEFTLKKRRDGNGASGAVEKM